MSTNKPFDYITAINSSKKDLMQTREDEKVYLPYITNGTLSYFADTVQAANVMNQYYDLDNKLQFDFLLNIIRKRKRFSKWNKPSEIEALDAVKEYYGYSNAKAKSVMSLLSPPQIKEIKARTYKGGRS
jgi:hypothetical protein